MTRLCSLFLFIMITTTVYGQYEPITNGNGVSWDLKHELFDAASMERLALGDTTTFNDKKYYKTFLRNNLLGYFREDTTKGKAWFWYLQDTSEYLIMDLSLNVNDSFLVKMYGDTFVRVASIDTVKGRKTITLNYHYGGGFISEKLKFIEGVGPNASLFYQAKNNPGYTFGYLVCKMYHDTTIVYAWDTVHFGCGQFAGIKEYPESKTSIEVFPNPTNSLVRFIIKDASLLDSWLTIYNIVGQKIIQKQIDKMDMLINLENFQGHIFIYKITGQENIISGKILKE